MEIFRRPGSTVVRAMPNPLDKATIVSIFPKELVENKITVFPGIFKIPAGSYENPSVLVIGTSSWFKDIIDQPSIEVMHSALQMAESVVNDYLNGILLCDMYEARPGIFFLNGEKTVEQIKKNHKAELDEAARRQKNWYSMLVKMADSLWAQTSGNPNSISDEMRIAARDLNLVDKPWLRDQAIIELVRCKACGHLGNGEFPICANCKTILDPKRYKELGLAAAV